jgi:cytochrome d ubiquinol oxidase subunit I
MASIKKAVPSQLKGWDRLHPWVHWGCGVVVGISGVASGIFVVAANSWMNAPAGFDWVDGQALNIDPVAAMFNDAWFSQALHMTIAAFVSTGFAVAGLHALLMLKNKHNLFHQTAMKIALSVGAVAAILQPLSGDISAKDVAKRQPAKLAAMEALFITSQPAPFVIGGIPDEDSREVNYAIHIPNLLSYLAHGDFNAEVTGLDAFPEDGQPPVLITHLAFQIMILCGMIMALVGFLFLLINWKWKHLLFTKWFLWIVTLAMPLGFIAVEAGWTVTEVGRQPWIIYGIMRTKDAVSSMPGLDVTFYIFTGLYFLLAFILVWLMRRQIKTLSYKYESAKYDKPLN